MSASRPNTLGYAALALATLGLCLTAWSWRSLGEAQRIHTLRQATLQELRELGAKSERDHGGFRLFEQLGATNTVTDLATAAALIVPSAQPVIGTATTEPLVAGWTLWRTDVEFTDVALHDVGRFIEYLENQLPPWRLAACDMTATAPGQGRVKLTLETAVRKAGP